MTSSLFLCWCVLSAQTSQAVRLQLTSERSASRAPSWHPDGEQLAFESDRRGNWDIFMVDRVTGIETALTVSDADDRYPAWSPTGDAIVFVSDRGGSPDLHILDVRQNQVRRLTIFPGEELFPAWAPDGRAVVFSVATGDAVHLMTFSLEEGTVSPMLVDQHQALWPRWSPHGDGVAFFSRRDTRGNDDEVYVFSPSEPEVRRVTHRVGHDFCPTWSPDGRRLAMASLFADGSRAVRIVAASDGEELGRLATSFFRVTEPAWSPDGRYIAYAARSSSDMTYQINVELIPQAAR